MKKVIAILCICIAAWPLAAARSEYVEEFDDTFVLRPVLAVYETGLDIESKDGKRTIEFAPNVGARLEFGFTLWWLGASFFSIKVPVPDEEERLRGKTTISDLSLSVWGKTFGIEFYSRGCEGYYIENRDVVGLADGDPGLIYPDLATVRLGLNVYLLDDENFSMKAARKQSERQIKNAGSWYLECSADFFAFENKTAIVPASLATDFGEAAREKAGASFSLLAGPGYGYTFVSGGFSVTLAGTLQVGWQWAVYSFVDSEADARDSGFVTKVDTMLAVNWHFGRGFAGLLVTGDTLAGTSAEDGVDISPSLIYGGLYGGMRF